MIRLSCLCLHNFSLNNGRNLLVDENAYGVRQNVVLMWTVNMIPLFWFYLLVSADDAVYKHILSLFILLFPIQGINLKCIANARFEILGQFFMKRILVPGAQSLSGTLNLLKASTK